MGDLGGCYNKKTVPLQSFIFLQTFMYDQNSDLWKYKQMII